ncbi:hypothetical protein Tco_0516050 [Tanacetum coccineum]
MSPQFKKSSNLYRENDNHMQERNNKKAKMIETDKNAPSTHFFKPVKIDEKGVLKFCYGEVQDNDFIWDNRYVEWCNENSSPDTPTLNFTSVQEDCKPRLKDYPFKDWLLTKVGHTNINEPIKKALLKTWLIDCFQEELVKGPRSRSFNDYQWMFDLEINQLADEYELGIGKKGHMLDDIWENFKKVQGDNTYWWHDHGLEENERQESGLDMEDNTLSKVLIARKWNLRSPRLIFMW